MTSLTSKDVLNKPFSDHSSNYEMRIREICQRAEMTSLGYLRAPMELLASLFLGASSLSML